MSARRHTCSLLAIGVGLAFALTATTASAGGDASGNLAAGGTVRGDISRAAGETDRVTIDLDAGVTLELRLAATFRTTVALDDPSGAPVDIDAAAGTRLHASVPIANAGTYTVAIASADGSQGNYQLSARPKWTRTTPISGSGARVVDVAAPAGTKLSGVVAPARGASGLPQITSLDDPTGVDLLQGAITPKGRVARLRPTVLPTAGIYALTIAPSDGTSAWTGRVIRIVPRVSPTTINLSNGLDALSFRGDGVGAIFTRHCAECHGWAASYQGVRGEARAALAKMASGAMPPGGGVSAAEVALVRTWIKTGMKP